MFNIKNCEYFTFLRIIYEKFSPGHYAECMKSMVYNNLNSLSDRGPINAQLVNEFKEMLYLSQKK
jgi:hypothetical protein